VGDREDERERRCELVEAAKLAAQRGGNVSSSCLSGGHLESGVHVYSLLKYTLTGALRFPVRRARAEKEEGRRSELAGG